MTTEINWKEIDWDNYTDICDVYRDTGYVPMLKRNELIDSDLDTLLKDVSYSEDTITYNGITRELYGVIIGVKILKNKLGKKMPDGMYSHIIRVHTTHGAYMLNLTDLTNMQD